MKLRLAALLCLAAAPAANAFDCAKAASKVEMAICADAALKAVDDAMSTAYGLVRAVTAGKELKALALSQRRWIKARDAQCGEDDKIAACISERTAARLHLLAGTAASGPGAPSKMHPFFVQQEGSSKVYDIDYALIRFAAPKSAGERTFNAEVQKIAKSAQLGPHGQELSEDMMLSSEASMEVTYASPRLISALVSSWSFDGGAHGNGGAGALNVDLDSGALIKISDVFKPAAMVKLMADCKAQIVKQKTEKLEGEPFLEADDPNYSDDSLAGGLKNFGQWTLYQDRAVVTYNAYEIGSYAEGGYSCKFPMADLKALAKPGAPLPE
jgi:uncharacterized protein